MEIQHLTIHKIAVADNHIELLSNPKKKTDFDRYVTNLIKEIADEEKGKKFKIRDLNTQVINIVRSNVLDSNFAGQDAITQRLLDKEIVAQEEIQRLNIAIQPGILIQAFINHGGKRKYLISKAENLKYINGRNYNGDEGYPEKKKVMKSVIISFEEDDNISDIFITDSSITLAKYWWNEFLELDKNHDDVYNTTTAFTAVDTVLSKIKRKYPSDHMYLRNSVVHSFKTKGDFQYDLFIENVFRNYHPVDESLDMDDLIEKLEKLPQKKGFDNRFETAPEEITARIKTIVNLTENIDLHIKRDIDIKHIIEPIIENNIKYIKIRTEEGYNTFRR